MINSYDQLPDKIKPYCTHDSATNEITLWDETQAYEVCKSVYPDVIVAALNTYGQILEKEGRQ